MTDLEVVRRFAELFEIAVDERKSTDGSTISAELYDSHDIPIVECAFDSATGNLTFQSDYNDERFVEGMRTDDDYCIRILRKVFKHCDITDVFKTLADVFDPYI